MPRWVARLLEWRTRRWVGVALAALVGYVVVHELTANYLLPRLRREFLSCFDFFGPLPDVCGTVLTAHRILPPAMGLVAVGLVFLIAIRPSRRTGSREARAS
ncbi:MAG TPA: hypothetical protein ENH15_06430 [Actinobacteria bacterium]|nr:hypothetical protein [Actinomycetota bacterium]